jgi:hypothetical protein
VIPHDSNAPPHIIYIYIFAAPPQIYISLAYKNGISEKNLGGGGQRGQKYGIAYDNPPDCGKGLFLLIGAPRTKARFGPLLGG